MDGYKMSPNDAQEELEEVQSDLKKREDEVGCSLFCRNTYDFISCFKTDEKHFNFSFLL